MILPCIDLMDRKVVQQINTRLDRKVVQLVQGREKALEGDSPERMLERFAAFPEIQVIDLDAAIGRGANDDLVEMLASKALIRAGGGVRTVERARTLLKQGAHRVIVGSSAFTGDGPDHAFLQSLTDGIGCERVHLEVLLARQHALGR